jgi:arabinose-5-phosphate isomerase
MIIPNKEKIYHLGKEVMAAEAQAIIDVSNRIGEDFYKTCQLLLNCKNRVVVLGMGKSGHIASKIAATLASTGTPAFFIHPGDAGHGDIGMIAKDDVVLAISNSGNTEELLTILPTLKKLGVSLVTLTGNPKSALAQAAWVNLDISVAKEACPLGLAPTTSTTAALAMGDALAVALIEARGFTTEDFAKRHPSGILGKKLLLSVDDLMRKGKDIPKVIEKTFIIDALVEMSRKHLGMTTVIDAANSNKLIGIFTDGDLRRVLDKGINVHTTIISQAMTTDCKTIPPGTLAIEALQLMETHKITALIVVENSSPIGVIHLHDLLKAGLT